MPRFASSGPSASLLLVSVALAGCPGPTPPPADGGQESSTALRFEPGPAPIDFGTMPFPDDFFLEDGHVELGDLPAEAEAFADYADTVRLAARDLDGFGATTPIFFPTTGGVDPTSLPASAPDSLLEDASVYLLDITSGSPTSGTKVPVVVRFDPARSLIVVRPWTGHPLHEGRTFAAVVTHGVRGADGLPISSAPLFSRVAATRTRPTDPVEARAWDELHQIFSLDVPPEVAGVAVFTVQSIERGLEDARAVVRETAPGAITIERAVSGTALDALLGTPVIDQAGLDVEGGVQHSHVAWVIDGTFSAPWLTSATPGVHGRFTYEPDGTLRSLADDTVWFTLALPAGDVSDLRAVVFQHGLGSDRSALFSVADSLCAEGWAVVGIDIPFHGMRAGDAAIVDRAHRFGTEPGGDLFGEVGGDTVNLAFVGAGDTDGELSPFHPFYVRDVLRQSASDLMALIHQLDDGDWSVVEAAGGPASLGFSAEPLGFVGVSLGAIVGTPFVTAEPRVGAAVLNVPGGVLTALVGGSATFHGSFLPLLSPRIGVDLSAEDFVALPPELLPELAIYQTLLDAGDSTAFAPILALTDKSLLFQMALDDEVVPNFSTEGLARAAGAEIAGDAMPRFTDLLRAPFPVAANVTVGSAMVTRGLVVFDPATHGLLSQRHDTQRFEHPVAFPFVELADPVPVDNSVDAAVEQLTRFFATWEVGVAEIAAPL